MKLLLEALTVNDGYMKMHSYPNYEHSSHGDNRGDS